MDKQRNLFILGRTYFFTVRLRDRQSTLLTDRIDLLRSSVRLTQSRRPFYINSAVVLPATIHMIWTLPPHDADFSKRWGQIKSMFSRHVDLPDHQSPSMHGGRNKGVWQPRFWAHLIRDQEDFDLHDHLIATAPLRAGLVARRDSWPYCSETKRRHRQMLPITQVIGAP